MVLHKLFLLQDAFEKVAVNFSEAECAAADTEQKQLYKASKQENECDAGPFGKEECLESESLLDYFLIIFLFRELDVREDSHTDNIARNY